MEQVKDVSKLVFVKARGGRFRWLTISTLMLAIGMLLHLVSPSVAGFTPNWMIACESSIGTLFAISLAFASSASVIRRATG